MVFIAIASAVFNVPVLIGLLLVVFCASIGISLGVRRAYIKVLLKIFEVRARFHLALNYDLVYRICATHTRISTSCTKPRHVVTKRTEYTWEYNNENESKHSTIETLFVYFKFRIKSRAEKPSKWTSMQSFMNAAVCRCTHSSIDSVAHIL